MSESKCSPWENANPAGVPNLSRVPTSSIWAGCNLPRSCPCPRTTCLMYPSLTTSTQHIATAAGHITSQARKTADLTESRSGDLPAPLSPGYWGSCTTPAVSLPTRAAAAHRVHGACALGAYAFDAVLVGLVSRWHCSLLFFRLFLILFSSSLFTSFPTFLKPDFVPITYGNRFFIETWPNEKMGDVCALCSWRYIVGFRSLIDFRPENVEFFGVFFFLSFFFLFLKEFLQQ